MVVPPVVGKNDMNAAQVLVHGTLMPDGKLELAETPALPAGPVEVLIRVQPQLKETNESWWDFLQRARAEMLAQGESVRSREEIEEDRSRNRQRDEARRQLLEKTQTP